MLTKFYDAMRFGVSADSFEAALDRLGTALGFATERPDRDWKEGPDNLWGLRDDDYIIFEAKSEVLPSRLEIRKGESEQMNNSAAWFEELRRSKRATAANHPDQNAR